MKVQYEILLFIFCLNLTVGAAIALGVPGTEYVSPAATDVNATEYEDHFNATDIAGQWEQSPFSGIPLIGDIYFGFNTLWQNIQYLVDGFPMLLTYLSNSYITDGGARDAFTIVANIMRAIYALLIVLFIVEFISGRIVTD